MAVLTYAQQLEQVQAAIGAIEGGAQEYQIWDGDMRRIVKRGDLKTLYDRETFLRGAAIREAQGGGPRITYGLMR